MTAKCQGGVGVFPTRGGGCPLRTSWNLNSKNGYFQHFPQEMPDFGEH